MDPNDLARLNQVLARIEDESRWEPPDPEVRLLERAGDATLREVALSPARPQIDRRRALSLLADRHRTDRNLSDLLTRLLDDRDTLLITDAIRLAPPFDLTLTCRLHAMVNDAREPVWLEAAWTLVRRRDPGAVPTVLNWLRTAEGPRFRFAAEALAWLLDPETRVDVLAPLWESPTARTPEDRRALALALRAAGDDRGEVVLGEAP